MHETSLGFTLIDMSSFKYEFDFRPNPTRLIDVAFRRVLWRMCAAFVLMTGLCWVLMILKGQSWLIQIFIAVILSLALFMLGVVLAVWLTKRRQIMQRIYRASDDDWLCHYEIDEDGIRFKTPQAEGVVKWGFKGRLFRHQEIWILQSGLLGFLPVSDKISDSMLMMVKDYLKNGAKAPCKVQKKITTDDGVNDE